MKQKVGYLKIEFVVYWEGGGSMADFGNIEYLCVWLRHEFF